MTDRIKLSDDEERDALLLGNNIAYRAGQGTDVAFGVARELVALRALLRECRRTHRRLPLSVQRVLNRFPTHSASLRLMQAEADRREHRDDR